MPVIGENEFLFCKTSRNSPTWIKSMNQILTEIHIDCVGIKHKRVADLRSLVVRADGRRHLARRHGPAVTPRTQIPTRIEALPLERDRRLQVQKLRLRLPATIPYYSQQRHEQQIPKQNHSDKKNPHSNAKNPPVEHRASKARSTIYKIKSHASCLFTSVGSTGPSSWPDMWAKLWRGFLLLRMAPW